MMMMAVVVVVGAGMVAEAKEEETLRMKLTQMQDDMVVMNKQIDALHNSRSKLKTAVEQRETEHKENVERLNSEKRILAANSERLESLQTGSASDIRAKYDALVKKRYNLQVVHHDMAKEHQKLYQSQIELEQRLRRASIEQYLMSSSKEMSPTMRGALLSSTEAFVPFFDTISVYMSANERFLDHVSDEINRYTHFNIRRSPFVSGLLFYLVLLIPVVAMTRFGLGLMRSTRKYSLSHFILFSSAYFFILAACSALSAILFRFDLVLFLLGGGGATGGHRARFLACLLVLTLVFLWHFGLLAIQSFASPDARNVSQLMATAVVGAHFFLFVPRRTFLNEAPDLRTHSYLVYATIFGFLVYERMTRLEMKVPTRAVVEDAARRVFLKFKTLVESKLKAMTGSSRSEKVRYSTRADRKIASKPRKGFLSGFLGGGGAGRKGKSRKLYPISDSETEAESGYSSYEEDRRSRRRSRR
uniref:Uncharacterized protein n=1 Tax=Erythrolobus madagascarensis TaxID=708628 RepID=A0A6T9YQP7_9RHOD|mmetsp:Transcript_1451/g.2998  ORF Transcript_1451/g.2998 Transcript_1451/m.2998 type:complete len:474 (+) Transcript_1451:2-1423(+)